MLHASAVRAGFVRRATRLLIAALLIALTSTLAPAVAAPGDADAAARKQRRIRVTKAVTIERVTYNRAALRRARTIRRTCGKSRSNRRIYKRVSRRRGNRVTTTSWMCGGLKRTVRLTYVQRLRLPVPVYIPVPVPTTQVPAPTPAPVKRTSFRLTLLHGNDGESKYDTGDSVPNYGGVARFATVLGRARAEAESYSDEETRAGRRGTGTITVSSGDNYLAGLNLRASMERWDQQTLPWYDSVAIGALGFDAATIGNHEFDFGPQRLAQFIIGDWTRTPFLSANTDMSGEPALAELRRVGRIASSAVVEEGGEKIGVIGLSPPETPTISAPGKVTFQSDVARIVNAEAAALSTRGINKIILSSHLQNARTSARWSGSCATSTS